MKNLTRFIFMLSIGTCSYLTPAAADEPIAPGTSFTEKIVNPGFDKDYSGWTLRIPEGKPTVNYSEIEVYNKVFDIYQTITGLPAGIYEVSADGFHRSTSNDGGTAYNQGKEIINAFIYAQTTLREKQTPLHSLYSVNFTASSDMLNGYVNQMKSAREAFDNGYYQNNVIDNIMVGEDGILTIGFKSVYPNVNSSWTIWDNVTLTYTGEAGLTPYFETIEEYYNKLSDLKNIQRMPSGIAKEIDDVLTYKEDLDNSTDKNELQLLIDSMTNVLGRSTAASIPMNQLEKLTIQADSYYNLGYPGKNELKEIMEEVINLMEENATTNNGKLVYTADLEAAILTLNAAIRNYRFTEPVPNKETGIDFTWAMSTPNFTKEGGNPSLLGDGLATNWVVDNVRTRTEVGYDCRVLTVGGKNCWNNWSSGGCDAMNVYQEFNDLPSGMYSFSLLTTNDGPVITDQRAYAKSLMGTFDSPIATYTYATDDNPDKKNFGTSTRWEALSVPTFPVGPDGILRVGMHSTMYAGSTSGWFCFTDCKLTYHGALDTDIYPTAMNKMIEEAEELKSSEMLPLYQHILQQAIEEAKKVDTSNNEAAGNGLKALGEVVDSTKASIQQLYSFKNEAYANAEKIIYDTDGSYNENIKTLVKGLLQSQDEILAKDTTTNNIFSGFSNTIKSYLSFVTAHQTCIEQASGSFTEITELVDKVLNSLIQIISEDSNRIEEAKEVCTGIISFTKTYESAENLTINEIYTEKARTQLIQTMNEQYQKIISDFSVYREAQQILESEIKKTSLALIGLSDDDEIDVTSWIVNPNIEQTHNSIKTAPDGWTCTTEGSNGNFTKEANGDTYFEAWNGNPSTIKFDYHQTITNMPSGYYRLEAMARNCQGAHANGAVVLYAASNKGEWQESIYNHALLTGDTIEVDENNNPILNNDGSVIYKNINLDTFDSYSVKEILVTYGTLTIGVKNTKPMNANWLGADDFKLYFTKAVDSNDIEQVGTDNGNTLIAYSQNGLIVVKGVTEYSISDLNGIPVSQNTPLVSGIYIVKANSQVVKVIINK